MVRIENPTQIRHLRRYSELTPEQQIIIRKFQKVGFGTIENLCFAKGEPLTHPAPKIRRQIRLKRNGNAKPPDPSDDFELKNEHVEFFNYLKEKGNGIITKIEVQNGLPAEMSVEEVD